MHGVLGPRARLRCGQCVAWRDSPLFRAHSSLFSSSRAAAFHLPPPPSQCTRCCSSPSRTTSCWPRARRAPCASSATPHSPRAGSARSPGAAPRSTARAPPPPAAHITSHLEVLTHIITSTLVGETFSNHAETGSLSCGAVVVRVDAKYYRPAEARCAACSLKRDLQVPPLPLFCSRLTHAIAGPAAGGRLLQSAAGAGLQPARNTVRRPRGRKRVRFFIVLSKLPPRSERLTGARAARSGGRGQGEAAARHPHRRGGAAAACSTRVASAAVGPAVRVAARRRRRADIPAGPDWRRGGGDMRGGRRRRDKPQRRSGPPHPAAALPRLLCRGGARRRRGERGRGGGGEAGVKRAREQITTEEVGISRRAHKNRTRRYQQSSTATGDGKSRAQNHRSLISTSCILK